MNSAQQDTLLCPHCETRNAEGAVMCHFCGEDLPRADVSESTAEEKSDAGIFPTVPMIHRGMAEWFMREGNCCLVALVVVLLPWLYWLVIALLNR